MATVNDLLERLKDKLLPYENAYDVRGSSDAALIRALDMGKQQVWMTVVASSQATGGNWFSRQGSVSYSSANSAALPSDFHSLLGAESTSVVMRPSSFAKQAWRDDRNQGASVDPATLDILYFVIGGHTDGTPRLHISRSVTSLTVTIHYTQKIAEWTASSDNIDDIPEPFWEAICDYAACHLLAAAQDAQISQLWHDKWLAGKAVIEGAVAVRQFAGKVSEEDYH